MTISEIESNIIEEFSLFDDWMDRYNHLIEMGKELKVIDEKYRVQNNLINGCQSRVWLHSEYKDGLIIFVLLFCRIRYGVDECGYRDRVFPPDVVECFICFVGLRVSARPVVRQNTHKPLNSL